MRVTDVKYSKDYSLLITFDNGRNKEIDFKKFLESSRNPDVSTYLDVKKFKKFRVENGDLIWGANEEMSFSEESLIKSGASFPIPKLSKSFLKEVQKYLEVHNPELAMLASEPLSEYKKGKALNDTKSRDSKLAGLLEEGLKSKSLSAKETRKEFKKRGVNY